MQYDYGLWPLVAVNVGLFAAFVLACLRPMDRREWRSLGVLSAFVVALFAEMYGFPLTIYLVASLVGRLPAGQPFSHASGNLWASLFLGSEWSGVFMLVGATLIGAGGWLVAEAWRRVHATHGRLVVEGPYAQLRHPQYAGIIVGIAGALVQWPTVITLAMAPVLVVMYWRLAAREDRELEVKFGDEYGAYRKRVPGFLPIWLVAWANQRRPLAHAVIRGFLRQSSGPPVQ